MKKLIHAAVGVACLSGLSGCITAAQQIAAAQDRTCQQWGAKPGTDAYYNCRVELSRQEIAKNAALEQYAAQAIFPPMKLCQYNSSTNGGLTLGTLNGM
jgi:hypothetical protein